MMDDEDVYGALVSILMFIGILYGWTTKAIPLTGTVPSFGKILGNTIEGTFRGMFVGLILALGFTAIYNVYIIIVRHIKED